MANVPVNRETVLEFHKGGKVGMRLAKPLKTQNDLCLAYTPGVAHAVKEIAAKPGTVFDYTAKRSLVAVVSDGTAIRCPSTRTTIGSSVCPIPSITRRPASPGRQT